MSTRSDQIADTNKASDEPRSDKQVLLTVLLTVLAMLVIIPTVGFVGTHLIWTGLENRIHADVYSCFFLFTTGTLGTWYVLRMGIGWATKEHQFIRPIEAIVVGIVYVLIVWFILHYSLTYADDYRGAAWTLGSFHEKKVGVKDPAGFLPKRDREAFREWMGKNPFPLPEVQP